MKRVVRVILCVMLACACLSGCGNKTAKQSGNETEVKRNIAVISGDSGSVEFESFFDGVHESFTDKGYSVDKFATGDEEYLKSLLEDCVKGGYAGVILYDLNEYAEEFSKKAKDAGVFVSVFSHEPYECENAVVVYYDRSEMTELAVDELAALYEEGEDSEKVGVKVWHNDASRANVAKSEDFDSYAEENDFPVTVEIYEETVESGLSRNAKAELDDLPAAGFGYIWAADDTTAASVAEYLKAQGINNAAVVSVGLVQKNIGKMFEYKDYWRAAGVVNYRTAGKVSAEVLLKSIENQEFEQAVQIPAFLVLSEDLSEDSTLEAIEELSKVE